LGHSLVRAFNADHRCPAIRDPDPIVRLDVFEPASFFELEVTTSSTRPTGGFTNCAEKSTGKFEEDTLNAGR
jgi:hypothetical protein